MEISKQNVVGPFPDPEIPDLDSEGIMVPPWTKYPNLPLGSMGWRMGIGEDYWYQYRSWWFKQLKRTRILARGKYPEPADWEGFYQRLKS